MRTLAPQARTQTRENCQCRLALFLHGTSRYHPDQRPALPQVLAVSVNVRNTRQRSASPQPIFAIISVCRCSVPQEQYGKSVTSPRGRRDRTTKRRQGTGRGPGSLKTVGISWKSNQMADRQSSGYPSGSLAAEPRELRVPLLPDAREPFICRHIAYTVMCGR